MTTKKEGEGYIEIPSDGYEGYDVEQGQSLQKGGQTTAGDAVYGASIYSNNLDDINVYGDKKLSFLRKVYMTLSFQLMVTCSICAVCMYINDVRDYILDNIYLFWVGFVSSIIVLICLYCIQSKYPCNFIMLTIWTLIESYLVGVICGLYVSIGAQNTILQAFILTIVAFIGLTIFTLQSKINFTFLRAGLFISLWILICWGIFNIIFGPQLIFLWSLFGCIVFCLFIIFDTYRIWKTNEFQYDIIIFRCN